MKEQKVVIKKKDFHSNHIFECGQCFRWNKEEDGSYTGIFQKNVLNVKESKDQVMFQGICEEEIGKTVENYFDLSTDYSKIKSELSKIDIYLKQSIEFGNGIRILNQDLWEMIISFIISANNNIPRIKGIIERISNKYGDEIIWNNKCYYTFPTKEQLAKASVSDLRNLGLGFRDERVYQTTQKILKKEVDLEALKKNVNTEEVRESLLTLPGVGPKVADCILLFGLKRFEVFPIDVWVRRVMNELYLKKQDETKASPKEIEILAKEKYDSLAGLAQQYLFYWKRETA